MTWEFYKQWKLKKYKEEDVKVRVVSGWRNYYKKWNPENKKECIQKKKLRRNALRSEEGQRQNKKKRGDCQVEQRERFLSESSDFFPILWKAWQFLWQKMFGRGDGNGAGCFRGNSEIEKNWREKGHASLRKK